MLSQLACFTASQKNSPLFLYISAFMRKLAYAIQEHLNLKSIVMNQLLLKTLLFFFSASLLLSCGREKELQTVNIKNRYTMELPASYKKVKDLNEEASLQYQNVLKEMYVIVIDEDKQVLAKALENNSLYDTYSNDLNGYSRLITDGMDASISVKKMPAFEETTINGIKARILSFDGLSSGYHVYWKLAFIEGNNRFYQIMVWTDFKNHDKSEKEMADIINSFKETDKSKSR